MDLRKRLKRMKIHALQNDKLRRYRSTDALRQATSSPSHLSSPTLRASVPSCLRASRSAFTLTELLVVIGIIALLLGLLLPATAAARYRARLVKCASNLRQVGQGIMQYANDNGGNYPPRDTTNPGIKATWLYVGSAAYDQRIFLKNYIDFDRLICPFTPRAIDYQNGVSASVEWTYQLWWGVQNQGVYPDQNGVQQHELFAFALGQPWTYKLVKYSVLACDTQYDWTSGGTDGSFTSEGSIPPPP